jgi:hypothetical protein
MLAALFAASAHAAPADWLEGTVLADCEYCQTEAFAAERKRIANQAGARHEPASGLGYVVTIEPEGAFVWGRAALVGTGNLIRTDAHVLVADTGRLKFPGRKVYFEPLQHRGASNLIEIDLSSVQRGGAVGPLETAVKDDWAIARLREDAIEKFDADRVFAFFWDSRLTQDQIVQPGFRRAAALVLSHDHTFELHASCRSVADDHPSRYAFGVEEVFFIGCPSEHVHVGSSGSTLAILSPDGTWSLGGQLVAGGTSERVRAGPGGDSDAGHAFAQQLLLGNVPMFRETMTIVYLQELIRRGLDPRDR